MKAKDILRFFCIIMAVLCIVSFAGCGIKDNADLSGSVFNDSNYESGKDIYLKIDNIEGQSLDNKHDKWIDVRDYKLGSYRDSIDANTLGRSNFEPFEFVHLVDVATPKIQSYCCTGNKTRQMQLDVCKTTAGKQEVILKVIFEDCIISSAEICLDDDGNNIEHVKVIPQKVTWTVTEINMDNSIGGRVETNYDLSRNR